MLCDQVGGKLSTTADKPDLKAYGCEAVVGSLTSRFSFEDLRFRPGSCLVWATSLPNSRHRIPDSSVLFNTRQLAGGWWLLAAAVLYRTYNPDRR